jgi:hypothetical protein
VGRVQRVGYRLSDDRSALGERGAVITNSTEAPTEPRAVERRGGGGQRAHAVPRSSLCCSFHAARLSESAARTTPQKRRAPHRACDDPYHRRPLNARRARAVQRV